MKTSQKVATAPYTITSYVIGFGLSAYLTLMAYLSVTHHLFPRSVLLYLLPVTALLQFVVQLLCFLHIGRELKPRWKLAVFGFMLLIVTILVSGSIWIMANLNRYHFTSEQQNQYLKSQDRL